MPRGLTGKVLKRELRERFAGRFGDAGVRADGPLGDQARATPQE